jgi:hypothetical protein
MNIILVGPNGRPSILDMLNTYNFNTEINIVTYKRLRTGKTVWILYNKINGLVTEKKLLTPPSFTADDKVVMWGTRIQLDFDKATVYNDVNSLNHASNKKLAREIFIKNDIAAPKLISIEELTTCKYPVIIRKSHHHAGIGFHIANNRNEALIIVKAMKNEEYYISEFYPKTAEYRVHCASGKVLLLKQKPTPEDKTMIAWNFHQNELPWSTIERKDYDVDMVKLALNAIKAVGLDFGAVDIMSYPTDKTLSIHVVAEINTAPSYTPYLISKYGAYFDYIFSSDTKVEHWDYNIFKKGKSLSWKNNQLKK